MRLLRGDLGWTAALGLALGALGPFGTFLQAPLWERLIYWPFVLILACVLLRPSLLWTDRLGGRAGVSRSVARPAAIVAVSVPLTLLVWLASFRHTPSFWPGLSDYLRLYVSVAFVAALMMLLFYVRDALAQQSPAATAAAQAPEEDGSAPERPQDRLPPFFARLPACRSADILAVEVEDHYVRAHMAAGSRLLLMRMSDAIAELEGYPGAQVHRSWWVASHAIHEVQGTARHRRLVLRNGLTVPVARTRLAEVERLVEDRRPRRSAS